MEKLGKQLVVLATIIVLGLGSLVWTLPYTPRVSALTNPCAADPNNLTLNGSMYGPGHSTAYGVVANSWNPFVLSTGIPVFEWVNYNSNGDVANTGSQYIWADYQPYGAGPFDAGIYQTITGLSAGTFYRFWLGSALAAYDYNGSGNQRTDLIGRQVGVDRFGGIDPTSANVTWGPVYWDGNAALNIPALSMVFKPQADRATIFLRVVNTNNLGRSKVWFDAVCMELMNPQPTLTPTPGPVYLPLIKVSQVPTLPPSSLRVGEESVTLNAYPYEAFWSDAYDATFNLTYKRFDAIAYGKASRSPTSKTLKTVFIENDFLRLTFLPEIGGRLWQVLYKPTGQTVFYNNRVLKPSPWGPPQQGGWLGVGGMEWALPVDEHGYEWGVPWQYSIEQAADHATITLWDSLANDRVRAKIAVTLPANAAYYVVHPRIENPTNATLKLQFWINAQIALGAVKVSPETQFILPTSQVFVHSTGDDLIPSQYIPPSNATAPVQPMPWSVVGGRDLSWYKTWADYLGVFAATPLLNYAGAYNHTNDLGIVRIFPLDRASGVKLFAWSANFRGQNLWTDDGSDYFELWGGLPRTFFRDDNVTFAAGEAREWDEYWVPFIRTGGLSAATNRAVLGLTINSSYRATVGVCTTKANTSGDLTLLRNGVEIKHWALMLSPGNSFREQFDVPSGGQYKLRFVATDGTLLAETQ